MTLANIPLNKITELDLLALCENNVRESLSIEFKRDIYEKNADGKKSF